MSTRSLKYIVFHFILYIFFILVSISNVHDNLLFSDCKANSAKWEPPHGRFLQFLYPWSQYLKVAAVLRHCAYEVMALDTILHSEIQAPYNLRILFESEIKEVSNEVADLIRILGRDISSMKWSLKNSQVKRVHSATKRLQHSMQLHSYLLLKTTSEEDSEITTDLLPRMRALESTEALSLVNFTSSIIEFVARVDYLVEEVDRLSKMAKFKHDGQ
ncbi:aluminum-activated malate transporter 9-like [Arachis duranensis]|uniref:Aluminum-activated malate transporter 9-like n=1 Tax=Arachis duranensis TaxID=130453 RepID=A0A9C6WJ35_ARADU|nr:aluminum-activated malate transporter 9-like [Arachis duranensis]